MLKLLKQKENGEVANLLSMNNKDTPTTGLKATANTATGLREIGDEGISCSSFDYHCYHWYGTNMTAQLNLSSLTFMTVLKEKRRKLKALKLQIPEVIHRISNTNQRGCLLFKALINLENENPHSNSANLDLVSKTFYTTFGSHKMNQTRHKVEQDLQSVAILKFMELLVSVFMYVNMYTQWIALS